MTDKAQLALVQKLWTALKAKQAEVWALSEEIERVLSGADGIGTVLHRLEEAFDAIWCARYAPGQTDRYVWRYVQDRPNLKRLLRALSEAELQARFVVYVKNDDPFYVKNRHTFGLFVSSVNSHTAAPVAPVYEPWVCPHEPRCPHRAACAVVAARGEARA